MSKRERTINKAEKDAQALVKTYADGMKGDVKKEDRLFTKIGVLSKNISKTFQTIRMGEADGVELEQLLATIPDSVNKRIAAIEEIYNLSSPSVK